MGHRVLFVTNNSSPRREEHVAALAAIGVPDAEVLSSAMAAAALVAPGERVLVCAGPGVVEAVTARGAHVTADGPADVVVVGLHRSFDYDGLTRAARAVRQGARLIGTNSDATFPTPDGPTPGGGAILAAVEAASGQRAIIAGKPHDPMAELVRSVVGPSLGPAWMIGDRSSTDGRFAATLGCRFALVRSGVDAHHEAPEVAPDLEGDHLADVVATLCA
jgi:HAD superfamily hydrolase (TIGR01450 family)